MIESHAHVSYRSPNESKSGQPQAAGGSCLPQAEGSDEAALHCAATFIQRDLATSELIARGREQETFQRQQELIVEWARANELIIDAESFEGLALVSNSTSEHEVRYRFSDDRAVKRTWAGNYGQVPTIKNGAIDRKPASPRQYLHRMRLQNEVFGSTFVLEGVCQSDKPSMIIGEPSGQPSFIVSQQWVYAADYNESAPSESEIDSFMIENGFRRIPASYFGWWRSADGVVIVDAKRDNFVRSPQGVIPVDLQMRQFTLEQLEAINLREGNVIIF